MSLKAKAQIKDERTFFLSLSDFNMTKMLKVFNTKPIAPSMPPATAEANVSFALKFDVKFILTRTIVK